MMFRILLKKQFYEIFRSYLYDARRNKAKPKSSIIGMFILFGVVLVFFAGTFFTMGAGICRPLYDAGFGWLYFCIFGGIALFFGMIGSAFSTYNMLYVAKDNELLLSMPIPVRTIAASRAACVYLLGLIYSGVIVVAAYAAYLIFAGDPRAIAGFFVFILVIPAVVFTLSCLLGWVIAKIGARIKNKSIITVIASVALIAGYYFIYFKAQSLVSALVENAAQYGEKIRGSAYALYVFGAAGAGELVPALICVAVAAALFALVWLLLKSTFFGITGSSASVKKTVYREKRMKSAGAGSALFVKELKRFLASPMYMLNCGLAALFLPAAGALLLWRGNFVISAISDTAGRFSGLIAVMLCAVICMIGSTNSISAMSVSLEGKNIWIVRSVPVHAFDVLRAKIRLHLLLTGVPALFCAVCAAVIVDGAVYVKILMAVFCVLFVCLDAIVKMFIGLRFAELGWTSEAVIIKQSRCSLICLFGGWGLAAAVALPYLPLCLFVDPGVYLGVICALMSAGAAVLYSALKKHGPAMFEAL